MPDKEKPEYLLPNPMAGAFRRKLQTPPARAPDGYEWVQAGGAWMLFPKGEPVSPLSDPHILGSAKGGGASRSLTTQQAEEMREQALSEPTYAITDEAGREQYRSNQEPKKPAKLSPEMQALAGKVERERAAQRERDQAEAEAQLKRHEELYAPKPAAPPPGFRVPRFSFYNEKARTWDHTDPNGYNDYSEWL